MTTTLETGFTRLKSPPGVSAVSLPLPDGSTYTVRPEEDGGSVDVPDTVAAELTASHGFQVLAAPGMTDGELRKLRARRDELAARVRGLEGEALAVAADGADVVSRLDAVKSRLASGDGSLDETRNAERAVEEARSRSALIAEAVSMALAEAAAVARRVSDEEYVRETIRQNTEAAPLIAAAQVKANGFAEAVVAARSALVARVAILDKLAADFPRVTVPTLTLEDLGVRLQSALADSEIERQGSSSPWFRGLAEVVIVGVYGLHTAEALARLAAVRVTK